MHDALEGADLSTKALHQLFVLSELGVDQLEDDLALGGLVEGNMSLAKRACAELLLELEATRNYAFRHRVSSPPTGALEGAGG